MLILSSLSELSARIRGTCWCREGRRTLWCHGGRECDAKFKFFVIQWIFILCASPVLVFILLHVFREIGQPKPDLIKSLHSSTVHLTLNVFDTRFQVTKGTWYSFIHSIVYLAIKSDTINEYVVNFLAIKIAIKYSKFVFK